LEGALNSHHVSNNNNTPSTKSNSAAADAASFKIQKFFQSSSTTATAEPVTTKLTKQQMKKNEELAKTAPPRSNSIQSFFLKPTAKTAESIPAGKAQKDEPPVTSVVTTSELVMSTDDSDGSDDAEYENRQRLRRKRRKNSLRREVVLGGAKKQLVHAADIGLWLNEEAQQCLTPTKSSVKIHTESLILFDEVDVVFREDVGFFSAINHFIKKSRKPIVLTTSDHFLQDKITLNIEKIQFSRPRVDAGVKFLKNVAVAERNELDTSTAYKIVHDCKCDMRRALCQLQAVLAATGPNPVQSCHRLLDVYRKSAAASSTLNLARHLTRHVFTAPKCAHHTPSLYFDNLFVLDSLSRRLTHLFKLDCSDINGVNAVGADTSDRAYDLFLIKDGLSDHSTATTTSSNLAFNPFLTQQQIQGAAQYERNTDSVHSLDRFDLTKFNTTYLKHELLELYEHVMTLFNENGSSNNTIDFADWCKHGRSDRLGYAASSCMSRFAQHTNKFTSNKSLGLEYRPFLHEICRLEELKQQSQAKRRYLHYFGNTSNGLTREDYSLLAKSSLDELAQTNSAELATTPALPGMFDNSKLYTDES
jgi:hypothetical protein